ncbi:zinc-dependent alcohol dehydrogenase family protein [Pseudomonas anguilliseptica]|uniref:NADPH2:quinone reductase n=1 Tax=Pseudomonas anguilliseptica TaxID=53406 RepID=A0A1H4UEL8_PSEAG|nr:zinc-dependent alcohol dehydrogenase family protein [Pseudomonas anguilliseptica]SEC66731.1 NADPH2:quinone reductase [Pseudomonas anguilliseptica]
MKAFVINAFGPADVFEEVEMPTPQAAAGQLLIQVAATAINPLDYKLRRGDIPAFTHDFPAILHGDFAGTVSAVGTGVQGFAVGDAVYGCAGGVRGRQGALADYMLADAALVAHKPQNLSMAEAAAMPLVLLTAWEGLIDTAAIKPGDRVLVHGGTGGVGHIAAQLAKWQGAKVYTTVGTAEKAELSREYGADQVINYREQDVASYVERCTDCVGFDVVVDTVGGETFEQSLLATRVGGCIITVLAMGKLDMTVAWARKQTVHCVNMTWPMATSVGMEHHGFILREGAKLAESGKLRPLLDSQRFSFSEVAAAHVYAESGQALGKVSLTRD